MAVSLIFKFIEVFCVRILFSSSILQSLARWACAETQNILHLKFDHKLQYLSLVSADGHPRTNSICVLAETAPSNYVGAGEHMCVCALLIDFDQVTIEKNDRKYPKNETLVTDQTGSVVEHTQREKEKKWSLNSGC